MSGVVLHGRRVRFLGLRVRVGWWLRGLMVRFTNRYGWHDWMRHGFGAAERIECYFWELDEDLDEAPLKPKRPKNH